MIGRIFQRDGTFWMVDEVHHRENKDFTWLEVIATYSEFGPRPLWSSEPRKFFMDRKAKA